MTQGHSKDKGAEDRQGVGGVQEPSKAGLQDAYSNAPGPDAPNLADVLVRVTEGGRSVCRRPDELPPHLRAQVLSFVRWCMEQEGVRGQNAQEK